MLSVRAIYDGQELKLMEKVSIRKPRQVIITFLDTLESDPPAEEMHKMLQEGGAFEEQAMPVPYQFTPRAYLFG